jgi:hypothetical protein
MVVLFERGAIIDRLYYGTDTRAAELLVGSVLAVALFRRPPAATGRLVRLAPVLGVVCFACAAWAWTSVELTDAALYRGGFLLAALVSAGLIFSVAAERGPVSGLLSTGPFAAFGRITYGVYLFHWPIFLWLSEERTGLDGLPLFALRVGITAAAAMASYHLIEMPIRERRWNAGAPRLSWAIPPVVTALVLGGVVVGGRDVDTDLAGLGEAATAAPVRLAQDDGVLDVLVITDRDATALGDALAERARGSADLRVTVAPPFSCEGIDTGPPPLCTGWRETWSGAVETADPDVVLFHVTRWAKDEIAALSGVDDLAGQIGWTADVLDAGFDLLSARGATVVWSQDRLADEAEGVRRSAEPFYPAMLRILSARADTRRVGVGRALDDLLTDLRLYQRADASSAPRVMVVGDSTARAVGYGLERWGSETGAAVVWSRATEGCGIADGGEVRDASGRVVPVPEACVGLADSWAEGVAEFDPDVVLVLSHVFDLQNRRLDDWPGFLAPGDDRFDDYLVEEYTHAVDVLSAGGAQVVWFANPCVHYTFGGAVADGALETDRIRYVNDVVLGRLAHARPALKTFDLFKVLCPDGEYVQSMGGVEILRTDGVHFSADGSMWFAKEYGEAVLDLALR